MIICTSLTNTTISDGLLPDRFQPEGKVCIYVFIPNTSKQTYNYEAMEQQQIIRLAQIHSLKETWKDKQAVTEALQRLGSCHQS